MAWTEMMVPIENIENNLGTCSTKACPVNGVYDIEHGPQKAEERVVSGD